MATRYIPKNPTVSIVNGTDLTNPLFVPRYTLQLVPGNTRPDPPVLIRDSARATTILRPLFHGLDREQFLVACLDAKHAIIGVNVVSIGSLTLSIVHPREVFKPAILLNSAAIICVHNLCGAPHKLCYVTFRIMWSSCKLTRLRLPETCESTVSSCT